MKKLPPLELLDYIRFENGEVIALSNMPNNLKPIFEAYKTEHNSTKEKSDR